MTPENKQRQKQKQIVTKQIVVPDGLGGYTAMYVMVPEFASINLESIIEMRKQGWYV
jgi:hypothetical protein